MILYYIIPYLEEINRKLETTFLHESPQLRIKSETETQLIGASSKMRWWDPTAKIFVASHLGDQTLCLWRLPRCRVYVWACPRKHFARTRSGIVFLFNSSKYGFRLKDFFWTLSLEHLRSTIMCRQPGFRCSLRLSHATRITLINMFLVVFVTCEMPTVLYLRVAWCCSVQCSDRDLGQHRIVGLPVCIAAELQHSAAAGLLGHRAVSARAACCKAAAQQGLDMWCEWRACACKGEGGKRKRKLNNSKEFTKIW